MSLNIDFFFNKIINIYQQLNVQLLLHAYNKVKMHKKFIVKAEEDTSDIAFEMKIKIHLSVLCSIRFINT